MRIKVLKWNREKNYHVIEVPENENSSRNKADFFVGCGIPLEIKDGFDEYDNYDENCKDLIGKEFEMSKDCWSEQHQMYLPNDYHLTPSL